MNQDTNNLAIFGGCLGLVAFLLPWVGVAFIVGNNLLGALLNGQSPGIFALTEPIGALMMMIFGVLAAKLGRPAVILTFVGALLGIALLLFTLVQQFSLAFTSNTGAEKFGGILFLGIGFWIAAVGFILGLVSSLRTLRQ